MGMLHPVFLKTLHDQRRSLLWWLVSIVLIVLMYAAIWPSVRDQPSMNDFLDQMPEAFRSLFATSGANMSTPVGYIQIELLSFMGPALVLLYAVGQGSAAIAGEEDHGTIDLLLGAPVSRLRVLLDKALAMAVGCFVIAAVTGAALLIEGRAFDLVLPVSGVAAAMLHLALLGLVFGSMALAIGAATGNGALARGIPAALVVVSYLVNGLGGFVDWLGPVQSWSPFYQYVAHDPLLHGVSWPGVLVAVATVLVLFASGVWGFQRRDVHS